MHELHHQGHAVDGFLQTVNGRDAGMIERGERLGFLLESRQPVRILRQRIRQYLNGDLTVEPRVPRFPDFSHAARTDRREDFVWTQSSAREEGHSDTSNS